MTYTTKQIREFCDAFDRGELKYFGMRVVDPAHFTRVLHPDAVDGLRITPKPTPPVYEAWTDIKEVPLGDWYRPKDPNCLRRKIVGINTVTNQAHIAGNGLIDLQELFTDYVHSPDPFAPDNEWMVCGRVK